MKKSLIFLLILFLNSCTYTSNQEASSSKMNNHSIAQFSLDTKQYDSTSQAMIEEENDCVFDTSSYKFTTDAIKKYNSKIQYSWDNLEKEATVFLENKDTLILKIGGCNHFGYMATLKANIPFSDTKKLIAKAQ